MSDIPTLAEVQEEERQAKASAIETLYHMARQLLSSLDDVDRLRVDGVVTDLSGIVAEHLSISFTEYNLLQVTARLYRFMQEAGIGGLRP
jgi:hypothetical protein